MWERELVIATDETEMARFDALEERARTNAVPGLRQVDGSEIRWPRARLTATLARLSPRPRIQRG